MDQDEYIDIFVGYGVGGRYLRLLRQHWDLHVMVARSIGHRWDNLKGSRGFTQGDPLSPTIFNVVFNVVLCHYVMELAGKEA